MKFNDIKGLRVSNMAIGTAQLGLEYGIANITGKPDFQTAHRILAAALSLGVNTFDTAAAYGNSEEIIGTFVGEKDATVVTKLKKVEISGEPTFEEIYNHVKNEIQCSACRLKLAQIPICLLHGTADMTSYDGNVTRSLIKLKEEGLIKLIGSTVYTPDDVREFLSIREFDAIQLPINLFDTTLFREGLIDKLCDREIVVFARSIFLQGLFFLESERLPSYLQLAKKPLCQLHEISGDMGISVPELAVAFVRDLPGIVSLVLGVETVQQLENNIGLMKAPVLSNEVREKLLETFINLPIELTNPSLWGSVK